MNTVFPVEFSVRAGNGPSTSSGQGGPPRILQGFTRNVSEGGLCLEFKALQEGSADPLHQADVLLELTINPTFSREAILAQARVVWLKKEDARYLIGVAYDKIDPAAQKRLISYAHRMRWMPRVTGAVALVLLASLTGLALRNQALLRENTHLLQQLREGSVKLSDSTRALEETGKKGAETALRWMSRWLLSHQNLRTGLVASFEGDPSLKDTAFTYDQALAAQAFLLFGQSKNAETVLSFYDSRAQQDGGAFYNSYDVLGGGPLETVVHTGPNLWVGIAALQYGRHTGEDRFVPMARRIGDWAMRQQDAEGGLPGGPGLSWYGTEHNLDAYAFFGMLASVTGDAKYTRTRDAVLEWLKKYAYSNTGAPVNRGKGDGTIATDTFSWSIAALGPAKLVEIGFDPEGILGFAEKNCEVSVKFRHPDGQVLDVRGFDFAKDKHLGRGGVLSTEWTAQMAVSYQVLARYFRDTGDAEKARRYLEKADFYRNELQKMIITSPSRTGQGHGCLPYASIDNVDTGHGWRTPKGSSTGSVAGTAYGLFAWKGYNPFELEGEEPNAGL